MPRSKHPLSAAQRAEISRRNGAKSTGPKTVTGKETVSRNAIQHGLAGNKHIVLDDENPKAFDHLIAQYYAHFAPMDEVEADFVQRIAEAAWRLRRAVCMETAAFNCSRAEAEITIGEHYNNAGAPEIAYQAYQENRQTLESLHRYEQRILASAARRYRRSRQASPRSRTLPALAPPGRHRSHRGPGPRPRANSRATATPGIRPCASPGLPATH